MGKNFSLKSSSNDPLSAPFIKIDPSGSFLLGIMLVSRVLTLEFTPRFID